MASINALEAASEGAEPVTTEVSIALRTDRRVSRMACCILSLVTLSKSLPFSGRKANVRTGLPTKTCLGAGKDSPSSGPAVLSTLLKLRTTSGAMPLNFLEAGVPTAKSSSSASSAAASRAAAASIVSA
eukprot:CAMPEP_0206494748 /NCGR_PEP_ID=MMETSP0324_2-20121206/47965_1 /ASSEMBLY_ACC=CAM_ASM_000836 /TAXON_ID=2866 /ORGANISM="Crypthecodinium cohnii, Strain Seligo" /LENGTH=128 /DNA_ID=CAMNT_0053978567 /DNA_START=148 /DNA_END=534 /DNA_ORIENTATION=+